MSIGSGRTTDQIEVAFALTWRLQYVTRPVFSVEYSNGSWVTSSIQPHLQTAEVIPSSRCTNIHYLTAFEFGVVYFRHRLPPYPRRTRGCPSRHHHQQQHLLEVLMTAAPGLEGEHESGRSRALSQQRRYLCKIQNGNFCQTFMGQLPTKKWLKKKSSGQKKPLEDTRLLFVHDVSLH